MNFLNGIASRTKRMVAAATLAAAVSPMMALPSLAQDRVVFAGFGGVFEQMMRDQLIPLFKEQTGIDVNYVVGTALGNYSKVLASRDNPDVDVYWGNALTHHTGKTLGLFEQLDPEAVPNLAEVSEVALDEDGVGVASWIIALGIEYNTEAYEAAGLDAPTAWEDLWDPKLKGKVALFDYNIAMSQDFLPLMARINGGDEVDIEPGFEKIMSLKEAGNIGMFVGSGAEMDNIMTQGQMWATVNVSVRALAQKRSGAPVDFVFPEEGAGFFSNHLDIVKGAPNEEAASAWVNFLIGAEAQKIIAEVVGVAPVNMNVELDEELAKEVGLADNKLDNLIVIDRAVMNEKLEDWANRWTREIEG